MANYYNGRNNGTRRPQGYNGNNRNGGRQQKPDYGPPSAPYNFVQLGEGVVQPPLAEAVNAGDEQQLSKQYAQFIAEHGKYSGYFDISIKNITPLYIGSGKDGEFFSNGKDICIPGSSLKGSLKNIFKLVTSSSLRSDKENPDIANRHLYYRGLASAYSDFRNLYASHMVGTDQGKKAKSTALPGFLVRKKSDYYIVPLKSADAVEQKGIYKHIDEQHYVYIGLDANLRDRKPGIFWHNNYVDVFSGHMNDKKNFYRFGAPDWNAIYTVPEELIEDYRRDSSKGRYNLLDSRDAVNGAAIKSFSYRENPYDARNIVCIPYVKKGNRPVRDKFANARLGDYPNEANIIKSKYACDKAPADNISFLGACSQYDYIIPCFYAEENGAVTGFGASPYFRIAYKTSIGDHIPAKLNNAEIVDFTDAVFGKLDKWAGRVFFEDCYLEQEKAQYENKGLPKILATPNPTSFQMYLQSKGGKASLWDSQSHLRGYKLYWHKRDSWRAEDGGNSNMSSSFAPLKAGHTFVGKIRFENLDEYELGALCFLFTLGQEDSICYKLGAGKPIGMGSIKLRGRLVLRGEGYYEQLFDSTGFAECQTEADMEQFVQFFNGYMEQRLKDMGGRSLLSYQTQLDELRLILSTKYMNDPKNYPQWNEKTRYMVVGSKDRDNHDKDIANARTPLPTIKAVLGDGTPK